MSELKFKLTTESKINAWGIKLFRIEATVDFKNGNNEIKKGTKGGWVESEKINGSARVSDNAWIYDDAEVYGNAEVSGDARVCGSARVSDDAEVYGNAWVSGDARVSDDAEVYGNARVYGNAEVSGDAGVFGNAIIFGNARVFDDARVFGNAIIFGNARVSGDARVSLKKAYTKGHFLSSSDSTITPVVIDQSEEDGFDGSKDYKNLLVVGDYEINDIKTGTASQPKTINIGGKEYEVTDELTKALESLKEANQ